LKGVLGSRLGNERSQVIILGRLSYLGPSRRCRVQTDRGCRDVPGMSRPAGLRVNGRRGGRSLRGGRFGVGLARTGAVHNAASNGTGDTRRDAYGDRRLKGATDLLRI